MSEPKAVYEAMLIARAAVSLGEIDAALLEIERIASNINHAAKNITGTSG